MIYSQTLEVLHENNFGHIAKCKCCGEIQVGLGNALLTFSEKEFQEFDYFFNDIRAYITSSNPDDRKFTIQTKSKGVNLYLSYLELVNAVDLLDNAKIMMMVNGLLKNSL